MEVARMASDGVTTAVVALWAIEPVGDVFWGATDELSRWIGGEDTAFWRSAGWQLFRFWE